jgi:tetratricopeptide (TPR) repeat protein
MNLASSSTGSIDVALTNANRLLAQEPDLAREQAQEILRIVPHQPSAWMLLGLAHGRLGRREEALVALRRAVALRPDQPQAWRAIADHLDALGDRAGADAAYVRHVRQSARDPQLLAAAAALQANRLPEAESLLKQQLHIQPTDVAAMRMLAELAMRLGRNGDAEDLLERCLDLAPSFRGARQNFALVLHRNHKDPEALREIETLLGLDQANPGYRNLKAAILGRLGEYETTISIYETLLAEHPNSPRIWLSLAHALKTSGQNARSIEAYRKSIALDPAFGEAYWSLANLKTFRFSEEEFAAMHQQLGRKDLSVENRLHFEFALGKALEDKGEYEKSFGHYLQGNAQRLAQTPYQARDSTVRTARARATFTPAFFQERKDWGDPSPDPIFIVGLPRAGSTLIEQILASHPLVEGTQELPDIISLTRKLRRNAKLDESVSYHQVLFELENEQVQRLGQAYLGQTRIHRKTGTPFFIDKMPNNFLHIGLIQLILPNAKIIDARRHPLACCLSGFKQHFASGQNYTYSLDDIGHYYRDYVELMAHYDAVLPGRIHRVFHEAMIDDTEAEIRRLLDYCGLPFDERCLRFYENDRAVRTASSEQVRRPINRDGVDVWRHYEPWLDPLKEALGPVLESYPEVPQFTHTPFEPTLATTPGE